MWFCNKYQSIANKVTNEALKFVKLIWYNIDEKQYFLRFFRNFKMSNKEIVEV